MTAPNDETVLSVIARTLGYKPPIDGLLGSGFEQMLAFQQAMNIVQALGIDPEITAESLRKASRAVQEAKP